MQTSSSLYHDDGLPGQIGNGEPETERLKTRYIGQVTRLTIDDDPYVEAIYRVAVNVTPGYIPQFSYDGTGDADETEASAGATAQWNADPQFRALGLATDNGDGTIDIAWADYGRSWTVTLTATNDAIFTDSVQQAASSTAARLGVLVTRGTKSSDPRDARPLTVPTVATVVGQIRGFVAREDAGVEQPINPSPDGYDYYPAGRAVPVVNRGFGWVVCETAMTADGARYMRRTGTGIIGALRNDNAGGEAIDVSSIITIEEGGRAGGCCFIKINVPL